MANSLRLDWSLWKLLEFCWYILRQPKRVGYSEIVNFI